MQNPKKHIELLAPAKDLETGMDAIRFGADAVYIGPPKFGARSAAGNSIRDIEQLITYAHIFKAKVYATLNTLVLEHELEIARELIWQLYNIGIDAIIIQDFGLLNLDLPPVALHASTQTHNHTIEKVRLIENLGFSRVILARELSIDEIELIKQGTSIELETFIHGSLCVSYSGQCYLSKCLTNRSANRGECAQPCRSYYNLIDSNNKTIWRDKHLLSLKDLNLSTQINKLLQAGVQSLKIEGRLKDRAYVRNITAHYRIIIDKLLENNTFLQKSSAGQIIFDFIPDPEKTFNRGFTTYFAEGRTQNISTPETAKSIGEYIGKVVTATKNAFTLDTTSNLQNGDGLLALQPSGNVIGLRANTIYGNKVSIFENKAIEINAKIYRNHNMAFQYQVLNSGTQRFIPLLAHYSDTGTTVILELTSGDGTSITVSKQSSNETPQNEESLINTIKKQLSKSGDSVFRFYKITVTGKISFIKIAEINALRREAIELMTARLQVSAKPIPIQRIKSKQELANEIIDYKANIINSKSETLFTNLGYHVNEKGLDSTSDFNKKELMVTKHCLKFEIGHCPKKPNLIEPINIKYPIFLTDNANKYILDFDCKACVMKIKLSNL
jgi:putative protease